MNAKYGTNAQNKGSGHSYQALYAYKLRFAFTTDAGILSYLNGKEFRVGQVGFANEVLTYISPAQMHICFPEN